MINFKAFCEELELKILTTADGVTMVQAEALASRFLTGLLAVSKELKIYDLDARMRRSGLKAIKASVYIEVVSKADKKPTEAAIEHMINSDPKVLAEQCGLDEAEVERDDLYRYFDTFKEAHVHYRTISKGRFELT